MKKKMSALIALLGLCVGLWGCNSKTSEEASPVEDPIDQEVTAHLQAGEYAQAYHAAKAPEDKEKIIAENFFACLSYSIATNVDSDIEIVNAYFGEATAKTSDAFTSNDPVSAITNYKKLAEYVSFLTGEDVLEDYRYGIMTVRAEGLTRYCFAAVNEAKRIVDLKYTWVSIQQDSTDGDVDAFYKFVARSLVANGTTLDSAAIARLNETYLSGNPADVKFQFSLN